MMTPKKANRFTFFLLLYMAVLPFALFFVVNLLGYSQTPKWFTQAITLFQDFIAFVIPVCVFLFFSKQKITDLVPHERIDFKNAPLAIHSVNSSKILFASSDLTSSKTIFCF